MYNELHSTCDVQISDILSIHTRNSVYEFFVIDPLRAYGLLKGGVVGDCATEAFFCTPTTLDPGSRVQVLIETAKGTRYITTSTIRRVKHLRSE